MSAYVRNPQTIPDDSVGGSSVRQGVAEQNNVAINDLYTVINAHSNNEDGRSHVEIDEVLDTLTDTESAKVAAEAARDKAQEWAENPEDVEVETGAYSAKHHAIKAAASAAEAESFQVNLPLDISQGGTGQTDAASALAALGGEPADADIVKAPGGVLPAIDGSALTGIPINIIPAPQTIISANMGTRPSGWTSEDCDLPPDTLTYSGAVVTVEDGLQVAYAWDGHTKLSEVTPAGLPLDMAAESDGTYYVFADVSVSGDISVGYSDTAPECGHERINAGADIYNPKAGIMYDSSDTAIGRVYLGTAIVASGLVTAVYNYALGTQTRVPVNSGANIGTGSLTEYIEKNPFGCGKLSASVECYYSVDGNWLKTHWYSGTGVFVNHIGDSSIAILTGANVLTSGSNKTVSDVANARGRLVVMREF
jgi:hypothetical protein